ncbi:MAG TPA: hypothetical protein VFV39_06075, partial [Limnobacter sp.]|nr:hypothetical protein [Limnobacter sp.]
MMHSIELDTSDQFTVAEQHLLFLKNATGNVVHGAINLKKTDSLYLEYLFHALAPFLLRQSSGWPSRAMVIGLGAAEIARFMHAHFPECELHIAEISKHVIDLARRSFQCPPDGPKFTVHHCCGAEFVRQTDSTYDYLLVDGFSADGEPGPLESVDFYN